MTKRDSNSYFKTSAFESEFVDCLLIDCAMISDSGLRRSGADQRADGAGQAPQLPPPQGETHLPGGRAEGQDQTVQEADPGARAGPRYSRLLS